MWYLCSLSARGVRITNCDLSSRNSLSYRLNIGMATLVSSSKNDGEAIWFSPTSILSLAYTRACLLHPSSFLPQLRELWTLTSIYISLFSYIFSYYDWVFMYRYFVYRYRWVYSGKGILSSNIYIWMWSCGNHQSFMNLGYGSSYLMEYSSKHSRLLCLRYHQIPCFFAGGI